MADFRARIVAELDTANASQQANALVNQLRALSPVNIDVNLNLNQSSQALANLLSQLRQVGSIGGNQINIVNNASNALNNSFNNLRINLGNTQRQMRQFNSVQAETFGNQMTAWARNNSKAVQVYGQRLSELQTRLRTAINVQDVDGLRQVREEFRLLQSEARATGNVGKTFADSFASSFGTVARFAASYVSVYRIFNELKQGVQTVVDLDTALVDLQKTSTATNSQLNSFYKEANDIAKQYGTSTKQIIQGAAD